MNISPIVVSNMFTRAFIVLAVLSAGLIGCSEEQMPKDKQLEKFKTERAELDEKIRTLEKELSTPKSTREATPVSVISTSYAPFIHVIVVKGVVDSRSSINVVPKTAGQIVKLNVSNGQSVSRGQLLVELDAEMIRKGMIEVRTQLEFATTMYEKQKRIYDQKAGSEIQYLQAKNTKESLEQRLASMDEQVAMSRVVASTSGYIDNFTAKLGEMAMPGVPLFTIVNTSDMRVVADLAEPHIASVKSGAPVTIIFPELSDTIRTKLGQVSRSVNPVNRTFRVETVLPRVPELLKPNTTCNVLINDKTIPSAIGIPIASVVREGVKQFVYVVDDKSIVLKQEIQTGLTSGSLVEVTGGLAGGQQIIVRGMLDVASGQKVRIIQ